MLIYRPVCVSSALEFGSSGGWFWEAGTVRYRGTLFDTQKVVLWRKQKSFQLEFILITAKYF